MADTLANAITQVRLYLREPSGTPGGYWSDATITQAINQALRRIEDITLEHGAWALEAKATSNITANTYTYNFPTVSGYNVRRIRAVSLYAVGDDTTLPPRPLQEIQLPVGQQISSIYPMRQTGTPSVFWFVSPTSIEIRPTPDYTLANGLVWQYYKSFAVVSGSDAIPLPDADSYTELVVLSAVINLLLMDEEAISTRTQMLIQQREMRMRDYISFLSRGRRTTPLTVSIRAY